MLLAIHSLKHIHTKKRTSWSCFFTSLEGHCSQRWHIKGPTSFLEFPPPPCVDLVLQVKHGKAKGIPANLPTGQSYFLSSKKCSCSYSAYGKQTSWLFLTFKLRTPGTSTMRWRDCTATNHAHFQLNQTSTKQFLEHSVEQKNMISCKMNHDQLSTICKYLPRKLKNPPLWLVEFPAEAPFCQCWALPLPQLHHLFDWKSAPLASAGANDMPLSQFRNVKPQMSAWHVAAIHWSCENCSTQTRTS